MEQYKTEKQLTFPISYFSSECTKFLYTPKLWSHVYFIFRFHCISIFHPPPLLKVSKFKEKLEMLKNGEVLNPPPQIK